ncbi:Uncharacterized protein SCF082_LOCUS4000 [Durusdinium trenchii]|uniref:Uncharacterized protein n=1 Tax=Durusdinium trenchii TaxID=1381693 RepID=A0ABP0HZQ4_9DINO
MSNSAGWSVGQRCVLLAIPPYTSLAGQCGQVTKSDNGTYTVQLDNGLNLTDVPSVALSRIRNGPETSAVTSGAPESALSANATVFAPYAGLGGGTTKLQLQAARLKDSLTKAHGLAANTPQWGGLFWQAVKNEKDIYGIEPEIGNLLQSHGYIGDGTIGPPRAEELKRALQEVETLGAPAHGSGGTFARVADIGQGDNPEQMAWHLKLPADLQRADLFLHEQTNSHTAEEMQAVEEFRRQLNDLPLLPLPSPPRPVWKPKRSPRLRQRQKRRLAAWRVTMGMVKTINGLDDGRVASKLTTPDTAGEWTRMKVTAARSLALQHLLREGAAVARARRSLGLTGVQTSEAVKQLLKQPMDELGYLKLNDVKQVPLIADRIAEPACKNFIDMLDALPHEDAIFYAQEAHVVDPIGKCEVFFREAEKHYGFIGGTEDEYLKYLGREDVQYLWEWDTLDGIRAIAGVSADNPMKNTQDDIPDTGQAVDYEHVDDQALMTSDEDWLKLQTKRRGDENTIGASGYTVQGWCDEVRRVKQQPDRTMVVMHFFAGKDPYPSVWITEEMIGLERLMIFRRHEFQLGARGRELLSIPHALFHFIEEFDGGYGIVMSPLSEAEIDDILRQGESEGRWKYGDHITVGESRTVVKLHPDLAARVKKETLQTYRKALDPFLDYLNDKWELNSIEPADIDLLVLEYRSERELTRSQHTQLLASLEFFMPHLKGTLIYTKEAIKGRLTAEPIRHTVPLAPEAAYLFGAYHASRGNQRLAAAIFVQLGTGLRPSELLGLNTDHVFIPNNQSEFINIRLGVVQSAGRWLSETSFKTYIDTAGSLHVRTQISFNNLLKAANWCKQHIEDYFVGLSCLDGEAQPGRFGRSHAPTGPPPSRKSLPFAPTSGASQHAPEAKVERRAVDSTDGPFHTEGLRQRRASLGGTASGQSKGGSSTKGRGRGKLLPPGRAPQSIFG